MHKYYNNCNSMHGYTLTIFREPQFPTCHSCLFIAPITSTDCPPCAINANFNPTITSPSIANPDSTISTEC